jgi:hypothetical protein
MTPTSVAAALFEAKNRGMYHVVPCLSYLGLTVHTGFGRNISVFLAEPMSDDHFRQLAAL